MKSVRKGFFMQLKKISSVLLSATTVCLPQYSLAQTDFGPSFGSSNDGRLHIINDRDLEAEYRNRTAESSAPKNDTNISSVRERDEELRINVKSIDFESLPVFPELGITEEDVREQVEQWRTELMKEEERGEHGFTAEELDGLGSYLASIEALSKPGNLRGKNLEGLVDLLFQQRSRRGISITGLNEIARRLQRYYRSHGLFLAQVYVPAQDVNDGIVKLAVLEGVQGDVQTEGGKRYSHALLASPFVKDNGKIVNQARIEEGIYLLNDYPGLEVYGSFSSGEEVGETTLHIDVRREASSRYALRSDNYGSTFTGENRLFAITDLYNPLGFGDHLNVALMKSFEPEESELFQLSYDFPVIDVRTRARLAIDQTEFNVVDEDDPALSFLNIEGSNRIISAGLDHKFIRSRSKNLLGRFTITDKLTELDAVDDSFLQDDHAVGFNFGLVGDRLSSKIRALNAFDINFQYGKLISDVEAGRGSEYFKLEGNSTSFIFVPIPYTEISSRLLLKTSWQYSDFSLPSYEQQVLGGAQGVRGYTVRDFSADSAFYLGAEWYWNLPSSIDFDFPGGGRLTDFLQTAIFYDAAAGIQNTFEDGDKNNFVGLSSAGFLIKFNYADQFSTQLSIAKPIGQRESDESLLDSPRNLKVFADFTYFF